MFFEVKNLNYAYIKSPLVLKDVNLTLKKGEKALLLASKEQGKTTLIKTLSSFDSNYFGRIFLEGEDLKKIPDENKNFSVHFSQPVMFENKSVKFNIEFLLKSINKQCLSEAEMIDVLHKLKINCELAKKVKKLSLFEKRKFQLVRTLLKMPQMLFVDDVFVGLNNAEINEIFNLYHDFIESQKITTVFALSNESLKNMKEILTHFKFDKILYLNNAEVAEFESIDKFEKELSSIDMFNFVDGYNLIDADLVKEKNCFVLELNENKIVWLNKNFDKYFEGLKLTFADSEPVELALKNNLNFENLNDDEINKMIQNKQIMIYSKLDGKRLI